MPKFKDFNTENKLRIPLSAFAAQIIENDCMSFSQKKTTLLNTIILNYHQQAECSISLRIREYKDELKQQYIASRKSGMNDELVLVRKLVESKEKSLSSRYAKHYASDVNWQITLNKRVKAFLTEDSYVNEEIYYGDKPGHYVRALIEEYAKLPYHLREEIVFKQLIDLINTGISQKCVISLTNIKGSRISIRPYRIDTDPMSTYHYVVGYSTDTSVVKEDNTKIQYPPQVISVRISRLTSVDIQYYQSGIISEQEEKQILTELQEKTVQFVSGKSTLIKIWLSDAGIKKYNSQLHLRPVYIGKDTVDEHIYCFECTEAQIFYYFFSFGKDAKILSPEPLVQRFQDSYRDALGNYMS